MMFSHDAVYWYSTFHFYKSGIDLYFPFLKLILPILASQGELRNFLQSLKSLSNKGSMKI